MRSRVSRLPGLAACEGHRVQESEPSVGVFVSKSFFGSPLPRQGRRDHAAFSGRRDRNGRAEAFAHPSSQRARPGRAPSSSTGVASPYPNQVGADGAVLAFAERVPLPARSCLQVRSQTDQRLERIAPAENRLRSCSAGRFAVMILPQVHLRKPCYDFTFL